MTTAGQSFLNLTYCKTTYKEFIKPYLLNATSPSPRYSTDVTTLLPEHTSLEQENYMLFCSQSLFFLALLNFGGPKKESMNRVRSLLGMCFLLLR